MTRDSGSAERMSRRDFLKVAAAGALAGGGVLATPRRSVGLTINPRSSWAVDRPPLGALPGEDVRFLLVHHSASRNGHTAAEVPGILRSFYDYHTSSEKGWDDIAYNFLVDAFGGIWEGRSGSIAGSVAGDATGGNQGFSQLVCLIGDHNLAPPTSAAVASLTALLAWLADKHGIATAPGSDVTFTSKGSNLWPSGASVTTPTISGHRQMSKTTCPGDHLFAIVAGGLMADVTALRSGSPLPTTSTTQPVVSNTSAPVSTSTPVAAAAPVLGLTTTVPDPVPTAPSRTVTTAVVATVSRSSATEPTVVVSDAAGDVLPEGSGARFPLLWAAAGVGVAATTGLVWRLRRMGE